ncbi:MAG: hypothetical protein ACREBR_00805, partial [bacterium]
MKTVGSNQLVLDALGKPMTCMGGWNDPDNVAQLLSAVRVCHEAMGHRGDYGDRCEDCIAANKAGNFMGCLPHQGTPLVYCKGNPTMTELLRNEMKKSKKDASAYTPEGDVPLVPTELLLLRNYLVSSNDIAKFQTYVMVLVSTKLFLRANEVINLRIEDILLPYSNTRLDGATISLLVKVKGKSDKCNVSLMLWADDRIPKMCPVRHLLAYCYLIGIKGGYIFPGDSSL